MYNSGPLSGLKNGNRAYKVEVKREENIGSYHFIDGQKVFLRYPRQRQTCGRCFKVSHLCVGSGVAKKCEAAGGLKVDFVEYIQKLWEKIGYSPPNNDLELEAARSIDEVEEFTPVKKDKKIENAKYSGVTIRYFPKQSDIGEIMEFLH